MAVAEARAAWQRTANRCFVQEDAKRAPKLACCPPTSPSAKEVDTGPASAANAQDAEKACFLPFNWNSSYSNLSPNSRWWLHLKPNYGYQGGLAGEQLLSLDEMQGSSSFGNSTSKLSEYEIEYVDEFTVDKSLLDSQVKMSASVKNDLGTEDKFDTAFASDSLDDSLKLESIKDPTGFRMTESVDCPVSKPASELSFDSSCPWISDKKSEPWWRTADTEELAFLVAQRSHDLIENCDLPQPQTTSAKGDPCVRLGWVDHKRANALFLDPKARSFGQKNINTQTQRNTLEKSVYQKQWEEHLQLGTNKPLSDCNQRPMLETNANDNDSNKAQLLEALRHSQTRARQAEIAAKKACAEKERVVELIFRQASQLFAYKQWFHLLQLENLYFQIKNNRSQPISGIFPVTLPWLPQKTTKQRKNWHKFARGKREKRGCPKYDFGKYALMFALGLSLVGVGVLLGWTIGWMFPSF
nr:uncharacterized protein LOC109162854 [Ipomoea batatas]